MYLSIISLVQRWFHDEVKDLQFKKIEILYQNITNTTPWLQWFGLAC